MVDLQLLGCMALPNPKIPGSIFYFIIKDLLGNTMLHADALGRPHNIHPFETFLFVQPVYFPLFSLFHWLLYGQFSVLAFGVHHRHALCASFLASINLFGVKL